MRLLAALLLCLPLLGQDLRFPGRRNLFYEFTTPGGDTPRLWLRNLMLPVAWPREEAEFFALWEEEINQGAPTPAQLERLWTSEGWDPASPRTVLVDGAGRKLASWPGMPRPGEVLEALRASGWRPRLEVLEAFIRDHPTRPRPEPPASPSCSCGSCDWKTPGMPSSRRPRPRPFGRLFGTCAATPPGWTTPRC